MIVPLKKIHLIMRKADVISALEGLRVLGCIHVEHQDPLTGFQLTERREEVRILTETINILKQNKTAKDIEQKSFSDWTELVNAALKDTAEIEHLKETISKRQILINEWESWGNFNPKEIVELRGQGIYIQLCQKPTSENKELSDGALIKIIDSSGGMDRCVIVSQRKIDCPFDKVDMPALGLNEMSILQEEDRSRIIELEKRTQEKLCYLGLLEKTLLERQAVLEFEEVEQGMKDEGELALLKGFCPQDQCAILEQKAKQNHWGILVEDPDEEDRVPTLLVNPKWVNLSKPVLGVIEILPGYKEMDVSAVFLVFFTLFFAMLIGDAAYGAIFMAGVFYAQRKFGKKLEDQTVFYLGYILTGFTCFWGVLTGTYFGQAWLPSTIKAVVPWLNVTENIQWLCFTIALVHLSLARIWRGAIKFPSITFLAEVGWLLNVWGMYFLANMFVLKAPLPPFTGWLFGIGISMAFFFMFEPKEFLKKIGQEIIPFMLGVIGAGTDIVSYIRLFAVGLATVAVADAANAMPRDLPGIGYGFMVFLHVLNLILALMAILVHAIRLNVLEFSGHLGLEWAGFKYNPFKKKN